MLSSTLIERKARESFRVRWKRHSALEATQCVGSIRWT